MNKTKIEWCDYTWNPVTGCLNTCEYCYARKIAKRFGHTPEEIAFKPIIRKYKLSEPQFISKPQNIFVCSMADLFGDWIQDEWIQRVFDACEQAPQHRYFFLTKNPKRYEKIIPDKYRVIKGDKNCNMWFGNTLTKPHKDPIIMFNPPVKKFVSVEPLQENFNFYPDKMNWVIIGAETGNRKGKVIPKKKWIESIVNQVKRNGIPLFMKNNLKEIWGDELIQEYPFK